MEYQVYISGLGIFDQDPDTIKATNRKVFRPAQKQDKVPAPGRAGTIDDIRKHFTRAQRSVNQEGDKDNQVMTYVFSQANRLHDLLSAAGIPEPAASYALYQIYHESRAFNDYKYKQYNNGSGIKFRKQQGAKLGKNDYAWFDSLDNYIRAFKHELTKGSNPAGAKSLEDYATRLKANRYYEDSYSNYLHGLKRARLVLKVMPAAGRAGYNPKTGKIQDPKDMDIPGSEHHPDTPGSADHDDKQPNWWDKIPTMGKVGIGVAAFIVAIKAVQR